MAKYEFKVVTAPRKAGRAKGVRGHDQKYAHTLSAIMNEMAADGWNYFRAESLPVDEKAGMMGKTAEKYLSLLVFRRKLDESVEIAPGVIAPEPLVEVPGYLSDPIAEPTIDAEISDEDPMVLSHPESDENVPTLGPASRD